MRKSYLTPLLALAVALSLPMQALAHRAWVVPSATVLSGDDPWVTFDAAVSNTLFHADHAAMRLQGLQAIAPDGKTVEISNSSTGKYRSTFDLQLAQQGTYKVAFTSGGLFARWQDKEGKRHMWPERGKTATDADFATAVPKDAKDLQVSRSYRSIETYVTRGEPTTKALAATGKGFELVPVTHPNDLVAGESARFTLLIEGQPAVGAEVTVIAGAMRYRDGQQEIKATSDDKGQLSITWPHAGMFWLSASYSDDKAKAPATKRTGSLSVTLEVLPE